MDWESVLNHVDRMRQLDLSSEEEEDSNTEEGKEKKERKRNQKKRHPSTETQSTRMSEDVDNSNTDPFTVMDTVREEEEEEAKKRRKSAMLSDSTVRWIQIAPCHMSQLLGGFRLPCNVFSFTGGFR